jgi:hypothetical protein
MSSRSGSKTVRVILILWFCLALIAGISGRFRVVSAPIVAATIWTSTAVALFACWKSPAIKSWAAIVDLRWLIALHLTRFVGFYFLFLSRRGRLPEGFAVPGGIGDIAVAFIAGMILFIPALRRSRTILLRWNAFGLIDIVFVAFSALRFGLKDWQSMAPLRELPLSLLPTFLVPLIITSHVLIFIRAAKVRVKA